MMQKSNVISRLLFIVVLFDLYYCDFIIEIKQGKIKGRLRKNRRDDEFLSFQSIPYARPPLNEFRFKAPQQPEPWTGILDGTKDLPKCYQREMGIVGGQEDCLYLNVYTKRINVSENRLLPVMVYIHGGGYLDGSAKEDTLGPEYLLTEDIVLVTINYRLGIFGSLSFEDQTSGVPGNAGLKDQVMAFRWVRENIKKFGGNPNCITIAGHSVGAASVHLHMLSPMSKGLFHRAIMQSGSALAPWNYGVLGTGRLLAESLDVRASSTKEILDQLKNVSTEKIFAAQETIYSLPTIHERSYSSPVIEKQSNEPAFLPDFPVNIIQSGNLNAVPLVTGCTNSEGIIFYALSHFFTGKLIVSMDLNKSVPLDLNIKGNSALFNKVVEEIKTFYYGGNIPTIDDIQQHIKLLSSWFVYPFVRTVQAHLNYSEPIYAYKFSANTKLNYFKRLSDITATYSGAGHADELPYLFKFRQAETIEKNSLEEKISEQMVKLWTNFVIFGNPLPALTSTLTEKWTPVTKETFSYLDIEAKGITTAVNPEENIVNFWNRIYQTYSNKL